MWKKILSSARKIAAPSPYSSAPSPYSSTPSPLQVPTTSLTLISSFTDQQVPTTSLPLMSSVTHQSTSPPFIWLHPHLQSGQSPQSLLSLQAVRAFSKKSGRARRNDGNAPKKKGNSKPKSQSKKNRRGSIKCSYCTRTFDSPEALEQHQRAKHPDLFRPKIVHTCQGCGQTYTFFLDFQNHECQRPVHWNRAMTDKDLKEKKNLEKQAVAAKHQQKRIEEAAASKKP